MGPESSSQVVKLSLIFLSHLGNGHSGSVLLVDERSKSSLTLDEAVRNTHLFAKSGQPDNKFDGFNVVGNGNKFSLLLFNQLGDVIETELEVVGFGLLYFLF